MTAANVVGECCKQMVLLFAVLAILSAAIILLTFLARQKAGLIDENKVSDLPPANARPLFAPTDAEIRESKLIEKRSIAAASRDESARLHSAKLADLDSRLSQWTGHPNRRDTIELLHSAAELGDAASFSRTASGVLSVFRDFGIEGLADDDMAALVDSHYRLLPIEERMSGELFWLKEELAGLADRNK